MNTADSLFISHQTGFCALGKANTRSVLWKTFWCSIYIGYCTKCAFFKWMNLKLFPRQVTQYKSFNHMCKLERHTLRYLKVIR